MSMPNGEPVRVPMSLEDVVASLGQQVGGLSTQLAIRDSIIGHLQAENAELRAALAGLDEQKEPSARPASDGD